MNCTQRKNEMYTTKKLIVHSEKGKCTQRMNQKYKAKRVNVFSQRMKCTKRNSEALLNKGLPVCRNRETPKYPNTEREK